jgi:uncharacterized protein
MQQRVTLITLGVADLERSRRFYVAGLGWAPTFEVPGEICFIQVGHGLVLGLWDLAKLGDDAGAPATTGTPFTLASNVGSDAEVDAAFARAVEAGATPLKAPAPHPHVPMYHAYVADPDGHRWEIAHNPGLTVDADGSVRFESPA